MKVTQKHFKEFKDGFVEWYEKFGLTCYRIDFYQADMDNYAEIEINELGKVVSVNLCKELSKDAAEHFDPKEHGKHEAIHLLLNRLRWLGSSRYIEQSDLGEEWESVVRRIQRVLK